MACWQGRLVRVTSVTGTFVTRTCLHRRRRRVAFNITNCKDTAGLEALHIGTNYVLLLEHAPGVHGMNIKQTGATAKQSRTSSSIDILGLIRQVVSFLTELSKGQTRAPPRIPATSLSCMPTISHFCRPPSNRPLSGRSNLLLSRNRLQADGLFRRRRRVFFPSTRRRRQTVFTAQSSACRHGAVAGK